MLAGKIRRRRKPLDAHVDMTSMLDIVFIMLIFFIVTAVFLDEQGIDLTQPNGTATPQGRAISVYVFADGAASINGYRTDVKAVPSRVELLRAELPDATVSVRAAAETPLKNIVYLKDEFDSASVSVSFKIDPAD